MISRTQHCRCQYAAGSALSIGGSIGIRHTEYLLDPIRLFDTIEYSRVTNKRIGSNKRIG